MAHVDGTWATGESSVVAHVDGTWHGSAVFGRLQAMRRCGTGVGGGEGGGRLDDCNRHARAPAPGLIPGLANGKVASPIGLASRQSQLAFARGKNVHGTGSGGMERQQHARARASALGLIPGSASG